MEHVMCGYGIYGTITDTLMYLQISEGFIFKAVLLNSYSVCWSCHWSECVWQFCCGIISWLAECLWSSGIFKPCVISGFHNDIDENCAVLGYVASIGNSLLTFWDNQLGPILELIGCPKNLVRNYQYSLHNDPEERTSHLQTFIPWFW
jgi:hypothetical protein